MRNSIHESAEEEGMGEKGRGGTEDREEVEERGGGGERKKVKNGVGRDRNKRGGGVI